MDLPAVIDDLLQRTAEVLASRRRLPVSTYRLQFHAGFRFDQARAIVPYLRDLGITDCYASPYLKARPGSTHGYDISDHRVLNPEIGSEEDYEEWVRAMHEHGLGQLFDMVPNHMGIMGNANPWWNDVLENGPASPYASFFDIDWQPTKPALHGKVLLPVLGDQYGKSLEAIKLHFDPDTGAFSIHYYDNRFPVSPCSYGAILGQYAAELESGGGGTPPLPPDDEFLTEFQSIRTAIAHLPSRDVTDADRIAERQREKEVIKRRLARLAETSPTVRAFLERTVARFNGAPAAAPLDHPGGPHRFDLLDDLLNAQAYRLASWRVASDEINYRRFFDINELAALSMEKPEVFEATHELVLRLLREGKVNGLRIDHPDGLYDPGGYLDRLQQHFLLETARGLAEPEYQGVPWAELESPVRLAIATRVRAARAAGLGAGPPEAPGGDLLWRPLYVVVEKILAPEERLPESWPVHGTTGYEFLFALNNLFVDRDSARAFTRLYRHWSHSDVPFRELAYHKKLLILQVSLASELNVLAIQLDRLSEKHRWSRDFTLNNLRRALREVIACFEVYRSYITGRDISPHDQVYVERAVAQARRRNPATSGALFDFIRDVLLLRYQDEVGPEDQVAQRRFVGKFQQVTAPVMAKGMEDTAFYVYNRLVSLNEVGGDPAVFGLAVAAFHRRNFERQARFPYALSSTATHDTKRGEDTRVRISVLSEMPDLWQKAASRWARFNRKHRAHLDEELIPDGNEEYFLYQTLVGAWPLELLDPEQLPADRRAAAQEEFVGRVQAYVQKAMHEAKVHTSWVNPNPKFDEAIARFVAAILDEGKNSRFLKDFRSFERRVTHYALFSSLAQVVLKVCSPGVPDTYQGTELWDFSLVDPDNRRPVDYDQRRRLLTELQDREERSEGDLRALARELVEQRADGRIKLYTLMRALHCRRDNPGLCTAGEYLPAYAQGPWGDHVCSFVRRHGNRAALAAVPRLLGRLIEPPAVPLGAEVWKDARLVVPGFAPGTRWRNLYTSEVLTLQEPGGEGGEGQAVLRVAELFAHFPVALLVAEG